MSYQPNLIDLNYAINYKNLFLLIELEFSNVKYFGRYKEARMTQYTTSVTEFVEIRL
jgi:hypothetical protein